jgi:hypothetical protein
VAYFRFRELRDYRLPFGSTDAGKHLSFQWSRQGRVRSNGVEISSEPLPGCIGAGLEAGIPLFPVAELSHLRVKYDEGQVKRLRQKRAYFHTGTKWASRRLVRNHLRAAWDVSKLSGTETLAQIIYSEATQ